MKRQGRAGAILATTFVLGLVAAALFRWGAAPEKDAAPAPGEISVLTLLREMTDLDGLARRPADRYRAEQAASTDRRSRRPEDGEAWFANDDFVTETQANLVRVEPAPAVPGGGAPGKRYVLLDAAGPGAIVRIWSATPTGTLRIYIDGAAEPVLEATMAALLSGEIAPFDPPFAQVTARGYSLFFPIPYRTRALVTVDTIASVDPFSGQPMSKFFYQINTRRYAQPATARLRPFAEAELERAGASRRRAALTLAAAAREPEPAELAAAPMAGARTVAIAPATIEPGRPLQITLTAPAEGGGQIARLRLVTPERAPDKLRSTWLTIRFDDEETVRAPLIDFFGTGPSWTPYAALPLAVSADARDGALVCRFRMPFRARAVVSIARTAPGAVPIAGGELLVEPRRFDEDTLLFHAGWRPRQLVPTRPFSDWHIATLAGPGHLVGTALNVENPPGTAWWGEGDEKLWVDDEPFPSVFGTGAEDYFGYAWSTIETFAHAYHAQTRAGTGGFGGPFSMNRFHVIDPIPFTSALRFDFEVWHWSDTTIALDAMLYWYARPGARDDLPRE